MRRDYIVVTVTACNGNGRGSSVTWGREILHRHRVFAFLTRDMTEGVLLGPKPTEL